MKCTRTVIAVCLALSLGAALPQAALAKAEYVLKLGHGSSATNPYQTGALYFADKVKQYTNGKVEIQVFPSFQLGDDIVQAKAVQMGTQDMCLIASNNTTGFWRAIDIFTLPYLQPSYDAAKQVLFGPVGKEIAAKFQKATGMRIITYFTFGIRCIANNKHPVKVPDDLNGMKIRSPKNPIMLATYKALGANPVPVAFAELFTALQQGVADGCDMSPADIFHNKYYEVQKYMSTTNIFTGVTLVLINEKLFQKMPADIQKAMQKAADEAGPYEWKVNEEADAKSIEEVKKRGMQVLSPDIKPFKEKVKPVWQEFAKQVGGMEMIERVLAAQK
jgi:tripartite ATP-independent transporter DctP family solute receptor